MRRTLSLSLCLLIAAAPCFAGAKEDAKVRELLKEEGLQKKQAFVYSSAPAEETFMPPDRLCAPCHPPSGLMLCRT